jgi:lysylphosphatidylglycerol synthetase-like protein (DUF2156 family)
VAGLWPAALQATQIEPVARDWLDGRHERGFSMNLDRLLVPRADCVVAIAYDKSGVAQGFARFAVCAAGRTLTLDVAPRRGDAPNGVVERLIVEAVTYGRANDVAEVSLNFAGFREMFARTGVAARAVAGLAHVLDRWVDLGPLYRFNAKFQPQWRAQRGGPLVAGPRVGGAGRTSGRARTLASCARARRRAGTRPGDRASSRWSWMSREVRG